LPTVYIYLTDSGPLRFKHFDARRLTARLKKPAQSGSRGPIMNSMKWRVLATSRVSIRGWELKTRPGDLLERDVRLPLPEPASGEEGYLKTAFENAQLRILQVCCGPRRACAMTEHPDTPAILVVRANGWRARRAARAGRIREIGQRAWHGWS
jgi:hypothetical protein